MHDPLLDEVSRNAEVVVFKTVNGWVGYVRHRGMALVVAEDSAPNHVWRKAHFKGFHNFRYLKNTVLQQSMENQLVKSA